VESGRIEETKAGAATQLKRFQSFLTLPRETIPQLTAREAGTLLRSAAERLRLELVVNKAAVPTFLLLPLADAAPRVILFQTWHAEPMSMGRAVVEGAERLALVAALSALEHVANEVLTGAVSPPIALVAAPASGAGSQGLEEILREQRSRLQAEAAYWLRIAPPSSARRRRVFLGSRGRVVIAVRGGDGNPYRIRDQVVAELTEQAYGPRPLDFELIRKLAREADVAACLGEPEPSGTPEEPETRIRRALFDPRGDIVIPAATHPDRPRAWISFEIAEGMEPDAIARRVGDLSGGGEVDLVERFPWDRANINHPAIQTLIAHAKRQAEGAEIWPASPWPTPSGVFTRTLGIGLAEWAIPLPAGTTFRIPKPTEFEAIVRDAAGLIGNSGTSTR
jgi:hypothetical protein